MFIVTQGGSKPGWKLVTLSKKVNKS